MDLKIKNIELVNVINFLDGLNLKGLKGIHRTRLSRQLQEKLTEVMETEKELQEDLKDDKEKLKEDLKALHDDYAVVDGGDSRTMLESVKSVIKEIVENEDHEFSKNDAYGLEALYTAFKVDAE